MLTGNCRFRISLFGRPILEVEDILQDYDNNTCQVESYRVWRDATINDLSSIGINKVFKIDWHQNE